MTRQIGWTECVFREGTEISTPSVEQYIPLFVSQHPKRRSHLWLILREYSYISIPTYSKMYHQYTFYAFIFIHSFVFIKSTTNVYISTVAFIFNTKLCYTSINYLVYWYLISTYYSTLQQQLPTETYKKIINHRTHKLNSINNSKKLKQQTTFIPLPFIIELSEAIEIIIGTYQNIKIAHEPLIQI